jgi:hypothetical protein
MAMQPHILSWVNPTANTDGSAYTQSDNAGYTIEIDGTGTVSIPLAWGTSFDLSTLAEWSTLKSGTHTVALAVVSTAGVSSAYSAPATFSVLSVPNPPTGLAVA